VLDLDLILPGDPATLTGGYIYDRRISAGLREQGWSVRVHGLDPSFPQPTSAALEDARQRLQDLPDGRLVVIDGLALGGMPELVEAEARRLRVVALIHHPLAAETGVPAEQVAQLRRAERRALAAVTWTVCTSEHTARSVERQFGVDALRLDVVRPGTDRAAPAQGSAGPPLELLCVATVTPRKGHAVLLEALAQLADRSWRLTCVGSTARSPETVAGLWRRVESLGLAERIVLTGDVDEAGLEDRYARADLFVLPSHHEGYGMALAEALAHGLPVVSTTAGAVPDTVPPSAGLLVPPGDPEALAAALALVMDDADLRRRLASGAHAAGARLPTWGEACERFARVLTAVAFR
jgi:glycosyltransferase involved in cell wall biosynthesis